MKIFLLQRWKYFSCKGDAGREERNGRAICNQDSKEGHHHPGEMSSSKQPASFILFVSNQGVLLIEEDSKSNTRFKPPSPSISSWSSTAPSWTTPTSPGWRHRVHDGREEGVSNGSQAPVPSPTPFLFSDYGELEQNRFVGGIINMKEVMLERLFKYARISTTL